MKDLIVLTADKNTEFLLTGLFSRIPRVQLTKQVHFDIYTHIHKDAGVFNTAHEFLRPFCGLYRYALVVFDHEGCGHEVLSREEIEQQIESLLFANGWPERAGVIVISPEIENWIWVNSTHIKRSITWEFAQDIYDWLHAEGWKDPASLKPSRPKEAFEAVLYQTRTPRSSSIYREIAENASFNRCADPAFLKMIDLIQTWFQ